LFASAAFLLAAPLTAADVSLTVVTPSRIPQNITEVPASVEVILPEQLEGVSGDTLDQKLQNLVPGIVTSRSGGIFSQSGTLAMRGFNAQQDSGARVLVLLDGVPLNTSATGGVIWNDLVFSDIERIEVVKGAGSSIYGANALAGTINIITKKAKKGFELKSSYGTYNTRSVGARAGFNIGKLFVEMSGDKLKSDGYVADTAAETDTTKYDKRDVDMKQFGAKAAYDFGASGALTVDYAHSERYNGEGERYTDKANKTAFRQNDTDRVGAKWEGKTDCGIMWNATSFYKNVDYQKYTSKKDSMADANRQDYGLMMSASKDLSGFLLTGGMDAQDGAVFGKDTTYLTSTHYATDNGKRYTVAPYVQAEKKFMEERLKVLAGLRYDYAGFYDGYTWNSTVSDAEVKAGKDLAEKHWDKVSPKVALDWKYNDSVKQYISYAKGFSAPPLEDMVLGIKRGGTKTQVPNPDLRPETADTVETGFSVNPFDGFYADPSVYYTNSKDFIYGVYADSGMTLWQYQNLGEVQIYGFEIPLKYIWGNLSLSASYAQSHSKIIDGEIAVGSVNKDLSGNSLTYAPRHIYSAGASYKWDKTLFSLNWSHKSTQFDSDDNTTTLGGYSTTSVSVKSAVTKNITVGLTADNIFNERYIDSDDTLAPGRTFTGTVKVAF